MSNTLRKTVTKTYTPGSPGIEASPGQAWQPAYSYWQPQLVCSFSQLAPTQASLAELATGYYGNVNSSSTVVPTYDVASYSCRRVLSKVDVAEVPYVAPVAGEAATPSSLTTDFNLGWNAGGRSLDSFLTDGYAEFTMPPGVIAAVVGLNDSDSSPHYNEIDFGLYFTGGVVRVYENGAEKLYAGAYTSAEVFRVERRDGTVRYYRDDVLFYTSLSASTRPVMYLDASLYSGGDSVDSPVIAAESGASGSLLPLAGIAGDASTSTYAFAYTSFEALTGESYPASRSAGSFLPLVGTASQGAYASAIVVFEALTGSSENNELRPSYALCAGTLSVLVGAAHMLTGEVGGATTEMLALEGGITSDGPYAESRGTMYPLIGYSHAYEGIDGGHISSYVYSAADLAAVAEILVVMNEAGEVTATLAVQGIAAGTIDEAVSVEYTLAVVAEYAASVQADMSVTAGIPSASEPGEVWVVNWDSAANSRYEAYDFNSFATIDGVAYGVKDDGLYLLEGDDDDGDPIRASVGLGQRDFGTQHKKAVPYAYMGVSSTGEMILKVTANDTEYVYTARRADAHMKTQRVDLGRGLKATYYTFELFNNAGADFDLDSIEFAAVILDRRI